MPGFNDDNTLEDIHGCILVATWWPDTLQPFDIHAKLAVLEERIQDKLARNNNRTRQNWFTNALEYVRQARVVYRSGEIERGGKLLRLAWEQLESGNKAHRRKTRFVAGNGGEVGDMTPSD
jgi:hypothetical protein